MGLVGSYDGFFLSGIPEKTLNFATVLKPFDNYTWAFIAASLLSVILTFIVIDKASTIWIRKSSNNSFVQSINSIINNYVFDFNLLTG